MGSTRVAASSNLASSHHREHVGQQQGSQHHSMQSTASKPYARISASTAQVLRWEDRPLSKLAGRVGTSLAMAPKAVARA
eukprot:6898292-Pyramimonas_sp.AAC.1